MVIFAHPEGDIRPRRIIPHFRTVLPEQGHLPFGHIRCAQTTPSPTQRNLMTSPLLPGGGLLPFAGYSVRYLIDETTGAAWFAARGVLNVLQLDVSRNPGRHLTQTPEADKSFRALLSAQGLQRSIVITPAAAIALTRQRKRVIDRQVRAFLTHHAALLGLEAA